MQSAHDGPGSLRPRPRGSRFDASSLAAPLSLLVVLAAFVGLLGGTHPSDRGRDLALALAATTFALLNLPSAVAIARRREGRTTALLTLLARVAFAVVALRFVHGISHEGRHDAWRACRARIALGGEERCTFLHLCANEAPLSTEERARLLRIIRATPGCADP
jgi:hypothetical protein